MGELHDRIHKPTLLFSTFLSRYFALSGFRSLARTAHPLFAAGIANGPTPAKTSATTSSGLNDETRRPCSACSREFQYTCVKSNVKRQPDSYFNSISNLFQSQKSRTYMLNDIIRFTSYQFHLKEAKLMIDGIQFVDNCPRTLVFLRTDWKTKAVWYRTSRTSRMSWPMICLYGKYSSFRLTWALKYRQENI